MDTMQQKLTQLGFTQTHTVRGKAHIDALFPEKKRCEIYVLHFPDQTYYVGQAIDVCKRYEQHRSKAFPDVEQISFKPIPQAKLDKEEQYTIRELELGGVRLRNITYTSIPATSSELDVLMAVADQERWLDDLSFSDAGDARAAIPAAQYDKTNAKYRQFEQLHLPRDTKAEAVSLLRYYIHQFIPAYQRTEYDYWSLSCMPKTSGYQRLAALNMSKMEMLVLFPDGDMFVNVAVSEILKAYPTIADFHRAYHHASITQSFYEDAGFDQAHIRIGSFAEAWRVFADPAVQRSIRLLNLYRMRKRGSFYKQYHCPALVDAIYAVPLPDMQQKAKPAHPSEYLLTDVAEWQLIRGVELVNYGDYESAQVVLARAFTTFEKNLPHTKQRVSETMFYLGEACRDSGDYARAIEYYTQSLKYDPHDSAPYNNRGLAYHAQGDYPRAIQDYTRAIQIKPNDAAPYNNRGEAYYAQENYARAIQDYNRAIQIDSEYVNAYNNRGLAYHAQGDHTRAIQDYTSAIELDPNNIASYTYRGMAYGEQSDYTRAIQDYTRAIELDPNDAILALLRHNRGAAYAEQGDHARAIQDFNRAIELDLEYVNAYHSRGFAYAARGNTPEAIADLERYISMSDDAELIAEAQEKLRELRP